MPMKKIVFATNNVHKLEELRFILSADFRVLGLSDIGFGEEIPETGNTLAENASQKSHHIFDRFQLDCFSDDTGLEVDALDGRPGIYSARYAGENSTYEQNVDKLLNELKGVENRTARFKTVISLIVDGTEHLFEGRAEGVITKDKRGGKGFGYDPVFLPDGYEQTFAEMPAGLKNKISHRGKAVAKLVAFLNGL
ncbi:MAG: non-canonical purine NTP diphosphatase [Bacteroidales bacterium]|nr:non-canonical purine NTP diphosphatase [Bacteroidales bacterium]MCF6341288.1 non-canonical purine NTP diphosphatase [Bacteroidales bacterium]